MQITSHHFRCRCWGREKPCNRGTQQLNRVSCSDIEMHSHEVDHNMLRRDRKSVV